MELSRNYSFEERLAQLLNEFSKENSSDTPDFVLANYLEQCLTAFNLATHRREQFYGRTCGGVKNQYADEMLATELDELKRG
jgi:hypothetical protein